MPANRLEIANRVETELVEERGVDRVVGADHEQRIAVRRAADDSFGRDVAAGARAILDDELLAELVGQGLHDEARQDVDRLPGGKADDEAHRLRWIGLRRSQARNGWKRQQSGRQVLEPSARKFQRVLHVSPFGMNKRTRRNLAIRVWLR